MTFTRCQYTIILALAHPINSDHGDRTMKRLPARILIVALTFCLAFTSLTILTGELSSHAASNPTLKGSLNSNNKPHLTWTKASKAYNGYAVFKNGAVYKRFNKKTLSFIDTEAGDGQTNTYQIKTYKSKKKIKKTKQWYNKQTMKWQTKKPAKKYRGKSRTVKKTTYKYKYYKPYSNAVKIASKKADSITVSKNGTAFINGSLSLNKSTAIQVSVSSARAVSFTKSNNNVQVNYLNGQFYLTGKEVGTTTISFSTPASATWLAATATINITVKPNPCTSHTYDAATCTSPKTCINCGSTEGSALGHKWDAGKVTTPATTSATGVKTYTCSVCNGTKTETIPKVTNTTPTTPTTVDPEALKSNPYKGWDDDPYAIGSTVTMTDYKNKTRTFTKNYKNQWVSENYNIMRLTNDSLLCYNKEVDGEWAASGGTKMYNYHGTTFDMSSFGVFSGVPSSCYTFTAFNMDKNKLKIYPTDATIEPIETYTIDFNPQKTVQNMYVKNSLRIALAPDNGEVFTIKSVGNNESRISIAFTNDATSIGDGLGFCSTTINFQVSYDNKIIGDIKADSMKTSLHQNWSVSNCSRMSPVREKAFEIAWTAVQRQPIDYDTDMKKIENYIRTNYYYGEPIYLDGTNEELFNMKCTGGAIVLETYSVILYNKYGYTTPKGGSDITHRNFTPISNPPSDYYNTQGHK